MTGACLRKLKGHQSFVNSIHPARRGPQLLVSASDDGTVKVNSAFFWIFLFYFAPDFFAGLGHARSSGGTQFAKYVSTDGGYV
jgi:WD40 repeat protein